MSSDPAVLVEDVSKMYAMFKAPSDRLKQMIVPRLQGMAGRQPTRYFKEFWALRNVSFHMDRGETVGIIGRNGSGKSTLLQVVSGTLSPTTGRARVVGRLSALLELGTGFNPEFTGRENVLLNGQLKGFTRQDMEKRFDEIAAFADIGEFVEQPVKTYSSGMLVRLAFAVHAILDPDVLIVDEALAVGDVRFQVKCYDRLAELKKRGTSILFVSHDTGAVRRFCDKAVWLNDGQVVAQGDTFDVTAAFTAFMLGGAPITRVGATPAETPVAVAAPNPISSQPSADHPARPFAERFPFPEPRHEPLKWWGPRRGLIVGAAITDGNDVGLSEIPSRLTFCVHVVADLPADLPRDGLSIGFTIRTVTGLDIVVRSTFDAANIKALDPGTRVHVTFDIDNTLAAGDYRLAVTVENRSLATPSYYEYVEGALLFKVAASAYHWGLVVPEVPTRVVVVAS